MNEKDKPAIEQRLQKHQNILFFDGVCNFCDASVQFILAHEKNKRLFFSPMQGDFAQQFAEYYHLPFDNPDGLVIYRKGQVYTKSTAAIWVLPFLKWYFFPAWLFFLIPLGIRDYLYDKIARNRYRLFGKKEACAVPNPNLRTRFLD